MLLWLVFLAGVTCSTVRHFPLLDSAFVVGRAGEFGGRFQGSIQEVWDSEGFLSFEGRPTVWPLPTEPRTGLSYVHHPLLFHYIERFAVWRLGLTEFALRIYPLIGVAITSGFLALLAFRRWRIWGAVIIMLLQLLSDGMFYYGSAANYDSTVTAFILGAFVAEEFTTDKLRLSLIFLCSFLGIGHEWSGGLIAFGLVGLMIYRRKLDLSALFASLLGSALYVALHLVLVTHWEGTLGRAFEIMLMASSATGVSEVPIGFGEFIANQFSYFSRMWGYGSIPLLLSPLLFRKYIAKDTSFLLQIALCWVPIYVAWIGLFTARSWNHEGWCYLAHPGVMLGQTAVLYNIIVRPWNLKWKLPISIALIGAVSWGLWMPLSERLDRIEAGDVTKKAQGINAITNESDFVVTSRWTGPLYFYLNCSTFDTGPPKEELDELIQRFRRGDFPSMKRMILAIDREDRASFDRGDFERRNPGFHFHHEIEADLYFLSR
jgi:hypothetical protein